MDTNKKNEASSSSLDDIEKKIHANQVLYDQLHQSLVDESLAQVDEDEKSFCLLYTSPSPRDRSLSRMPSSA